MAAQFCLFSYFRLRCTSFPPSLFGYSCQDWRERGNTFGLFALLSRNQTDKRWDVMLPNVLGILQILQT